VPRSRGTYEGAGLLNRIASRFRTTITKLVHRRPACAADTRRGRSDTQGLDGERGQQSSHVGRADASIAILRTSCPPETLAARRAASPLGAARPADLASKQSAFALDLSRPVGSSRTAASQFVPCPDLWRQPSFPSADPRPTHRGQVHDPGATPDAPGGRQGHAHHENQRPGCTWEREFA
jgi:hypothetical protein